ncbi:hypothetical protein QTO34_000855 [Cnephaeus nilssonii]|uniref:Uncharacterized protein n=1 Tax=Cnephaeus nilssonii TaxID=3371016 RepID=A0AA40LV14_CNENI|nr:hypothetical protein QTO34_000855 [Eptesicus nilssonii]
MTFQRRNYYNTSKECKKAIGCNHILVEDQDIRTSHVLSKFPLLRMDKFSKDIESSDDEFYFENEEKSEKCNSDERIKESRKKRVQRLIFYQHLWPPLSSESSYWEKAINAVNVGNLLSGIMTFIVIQEFTLEKGLRSAVNVEIPLPFSILHCRKTVHTGERPYECSEWGNTLPKNSGKPEP